MPQGLYTNASTWNSITYTGWNQFAGWGLNSWANSWANTYSISTAFASNTSTNNAYTISAHWAPPAGPVVYERPLAMIDLPPLPPRPPGQRSVALARSRDLLMSCLTQEQRESFERLGRFRCVSDLGDVYEIEDRRMHNVFALDARGHRVQEWCVTPPGSFPVYDVMLAQKLALETDSLALADQANIMDLRTGQMVRRAERQFSYLAEPDYLRLANV